MRQESRRKEVKDEKTSQSPYQRKEVAPGYHVWIRAQKQNAERGYPPVILFQVKDLAAKSCGEPHIAPSWEIAKASLGAMLSKTPELAERAHAISIEYCGDWDPEDGITEKTFQTSCALDREWSCFGDVCLAEFRAACSKEEIEKQEEADNEQ